MTSAATEIQPYQRPALNGAGTRPPAISQSTAIEQQRAIAEVQAAVVVAQSCPRNMADAEREMEYVCGRLDMAEQAFYQVTNRGTGPTVHLMRELARIWGNVDHGVKELHRNDEAGESEIQAFAWDIQKNTRSSRTFIVPHQRMVKVNGVQQRKDLVDLQDIYLNNQNIGARAVRECIGTILPRWFTEKAQNVCHETLKNGEGKPLRERIEALINAFQAMSVTVGQLEVRVGRQRGQWTPEDVAQLTVAGQSIRRGEAQRDELFPPLDSTTTADEITQNQATDSGTKTRKPRTRKPSKANAPADVKQEQTADTESDPVEVPDQSEPVAEPKPGKTAARRASEKHLFSMINDVPGEIGDEAPISRDERLAIYRTVLKRQDIESTDDLDDDAVAAVADQLFQWHQFGELADQITEIRNNAAIDAAAAAEQSDTDTEVQ